MQQLEVPGAVIEYVTEGSGPPVLLTHGALVADAVIVPLAGQPALTSSCQLIGYRRRGYAANGNAGITGGTTLADYAADAAALLRHLGVDKAHVVGHSSGALISLQLACSSRSSECFDPSLHSAFCSWAADVSTFFLT